jgi:hypothetical protein
LPRSSSFHSFVFYIRRIGKPEKKGAGEPLKAHFMNESKKNEPFPKLLFLQGSCSETEVSEQL